MVRNIQSLEKYSLLGQGRESDEIDFFSEITFDDEVISRGGFANVHRVISINGKENRKLLIKIYHKDEHAEHAFLTIENLHLKLQIRQKDSRISTFQSYPTLLGLPFLAFLALDPLENKTMVGLVMYDLRQLGFLDYGNDQEIDENLSDIDPIACSFQLAKTIELLHEINFIHSDLKPASLFINPHSNKIALIDFDSGFHYNFQENPSTGGSITPWNRLLNYFKKESKINLEGRKIDPKDYKYNEIWALNAAVFQFFTGLQSPYSFLSTLDDKEKEQYIKKVGWPNFKKDFPYFKDSSEGEINRLQEALFTFKEAGFEGVVKLFSKSFNAGNFKSGEVATPIEWINELKPSLDQPEYSPKIKKINTSKSEIDYANEEISIECLAEEFDYISINNEISKIGQTDFKVKVPDDTEFEICFYNFYNSVSQKISIKANRREPTIQFFQFDKPIRTCELPIRLKWEVEDAYQIFINGKSYPYLKSGEIEVEPLEPTTYILECKGGFGEVSKAEIFVDVIKPTIDEFSYEINLDHGLENIDLKWKASNTKSVQIFPTIGETNIKGSAHVSIKGETQFTIIATGLFSSEQKVLNARPFPIPIIKELMIEFPKIEMNVQIKMAPLSIPDPMYQYGKINFSGWNIPSQREIGFFSEQTDFKKIELDPMNSDSSKDKFDYMSLNSLISRVFSFFKNRPNEKSI